MRDAGPTSLRDRTAAAIAPGSRGAALLCAAVALLAVTTAFTDSPGIGVLLALLATAGAAWARRSWLGLRRPRSWPRAIGLGLAAGIAIQALSLSILDPLSECLTGAAPDVSQFRGVRGNAAALALWLALVWLFVVFAEEWIFRGLLVTDLVALLGGDRAATSASVLASSVIFGLAHAYQGAGGVLGTGAVGLCLGALYVRAGSNLWPAVIAHGTIDTIGLWLIYANLDRVPAG